VVQKILLRANKSILLVRAYRLPFENPDQILYHRIFVGLDASARAEMVLPVAVRLAQHYNASLTLGMVIQKLDIVSRLPLSVEDEAIVEHITKKNLDAAARYLEQVREQLLPAGIEVRTRLEASSNILSSLHNMVDDLNLDLVMLVAHGHSADRRWPYGSVTASFLAHGNTTLFIMQDLGANDLQQSTSEQAMLQPQSH